MSHPVREHRRRFVAPVIGAGAVWLLVGCMGSALVLRPLVDSDGAVAEADAAAPRPVRLLVAPVSEFPDLSLRETALLTALYTAVWVRVRNESAVAHYLDPSELLLYDSTGTPWLPLDQSRRESYRRWRPWSVGRALRRLFYRDRIASLEEKLQTVTLTADWVAPGSTRGGLLLYKRIDRALCEQMVLEWRGAGREAAAPQAPGEAPAVSTARVALRC